MLIEEIMVAYLGDALAVPVYAEMPSHPPARFVVLDRTGGSTENGINTATFAIQSYAESVVEAAALNELVKQALEWDNLPTTILSTDLNSDYNYTDTAKRRYRYQAVFDIYY